VCSPFASASAGGLTGFNAVSGGSTISTNGNTTTIHQTADRAINQFSSFSIPAGSSVIFQQPNSSSIALNRIIGGSVSQINGILQANGNVWIINPNGILFGRGAQVDVGGLIATTSDIRNQDFLAGHDNFSIASSNPGAAIVNQGWLRAHDGGSVILAGMRVDNQGLIQADLGSVVLAAGKTFAVDLNGDKLLRFEVTAPVDQTPLDGNGNPVDALVTNSGKIEAKGGKVLLTARAAKNVIDNVINSTGIIEATTARMVNGEIVLDGGENGTVALAGTLDASGKGAGETGGTVKMVGETVSLAGTAVVDVSGAAGGGTALIGGQAHGAGRKHAQTSLVAGGALINADALSNGNGGTVVVWSDSFTDVAGTITARGGAHGGNGGSVETSSKGRLAIGAGAVILTAAPHGTAGQWLLDPTNLIIGSDPDGGHGNDDHNSYIDAQTIDAALNAGTSVILTAHGEGNGGANITVNDAITKTSAADDTLSLVAGGGIFINAAITQQGSAGTLGVALAAEDGVTVSSAIKTNGGAVQSTSESFTQQNGGTISVGAGQASITANTISLAGGAGTVTGTSGATISLQPLDPDAPIGIGATSLRFNLSKATLGAIAGFGKLQIGGWATPSVTLAGQVNLPVVTRISAGAWGDITLDPNVDVQTGGQSVTFTSPVILGGAGSNASTTANISTAGGAITFEGSIDGSVAGQQGLTLSAGTGAVALGTVGARTQLSSLSIGGGTISLAGVSSSGAQSYAGATAIDGSYVAGSFAVNGATTLTGNDSSIDTHVAGGAIKLGTVDGNHRLSLNAGAGTVTLGTVGGVAALSALNVTGSAINLASVTTSGSQSYSGTAAFNGTYSGENITAANGAILAGDSTFATTSDHGVISLAGVDGSKSLTLNAGNGTVDLGASGLQTPLASLSVTAGSINLASVTTSGAQSYTGATTIDGTYVAGSFAVNGATTLTGNDSPIDTHGAGGAIHLGTVDGNHRLSLNAGAGTVTLGTVGGVAALSALNVTGSAIHLASVTTSGSQSYSGTAFFNGTYVGENITAANGAILAGDSTFATTSDHGVISLAGVDGNKSLTLNAGNGTVDLGAAGLQTPLASLSATAGSINLASVTTSGAQSYTGATTIDGNYVAGSFAVNGATTLTGNDSSIDTHVAGGAIKLGTVDGGHRLSLNAGAGTVTLGTVGGIAALTALNVTGSAIHLASVTTSGSQTYTGTAFFNGTYVGENITAADSAILAGDSTFTTSSDHGGISLAGVDGSENLTLNAGNGTVDLGATGLQTALASLSVTAGSVHLASVTTTGALNITAAGTVTATGALTTVNADRNSGAITIAAGGDVSLSSINTSGVDSNAAGVPVTGAGAVSITGASIEVSGDILAIGGSASGTSTSAGGSGGSVTLHATAGAITLGNGSQGGNIETFGGDAVATGASAGAAGSIALTATGDVTGFSLDSFGGISWLGAGGAGAPITVNAGGSVDFVTLASLGGDSPIGQGAGGQSGAVQVTAGGGVSVADEVLSLNGRGSQSGDTSGAVTISAGGAVAIGADLPVGTASVATAGHDALSTGLGTGNGGAVTITGASITLTDGIAANGGTAIVAGPNGGNGGAITLTATDAVHGTVTVGSATSGSTTRLASYGGASVTGIGGTGANVRVSGVNLVLSSIRANGGDSIGPVTGAGANGGNITLTATATSGDAVVLFGNDDHAAAFSARGGEADLSSGGPAVGLGGDFTIQGANGGALAGTSDVRLQASTGTGNHQGAIVGIGVSGATGGAILINGPIVGTTAGVESLDFKDRVGFTPAQNGTATVTGSIGSTSLALGNIAVANGNFGAVHADSATFVGGSVTAQSLAISSATTLGGFGTTIDTHAANGAISLGTVDGAESLTLAAGTGMVTLGTIGGTTALSGLAVSGGSINLVSVTTTGAQSYGGPTVLGGLYTTTGAGGSFTVTGSTTLTAGTAIDTSAANGAISLGTVDGAESLTLAAGTAMVTLGTAGGAAALSGLSVSGGSISLASVTTTGAQSYSGPTVLGGLYTTTGAGGSFTVTGPTTLTAGTTAIDTSADNGAISLGSLDGAGALTLTSGTGAIAVNGAVGSATPLSSLALSGSSGAAFASTVNLGTLDLSRETGAVSVSGGLSVQSTLSITSTLIAGGPVSLGNVVVAGTSEINAGTHLLSIAGSVSQGANALTLTADQLSFGASASFSGTGARIVQSATVGAPIVLGGTSGSGGQGTLVLDQSVLDVLAGGTPSSVTIGRSDFSNSITSSPFTFDAPLILNGHDIALNGQAGAAGIAKNFGSLALNASGAVTGSVDLAAGTGLLDISADSAILTGSTVNGAGGQLAAIQVSVVLPHGAGPFKTNGLTDGTLPPPPAPVVKVVVPPTVLPPQPPPPAAPPPPPPEPPPTPPAGTGTQNLGQIAPQAGTGTGDQSGTDSPPNGNDALTTTISGPLQSSPPSQPQGKKPTTTRVLIYGLLNIQDPLRSGRTSHGTSGGSSDFSNWGNEGLW
jgi:filamentous hemagglutinin family protein